ncbi:MAG: IS200/IS605 family transposase [Candidatus Woesearchaeota archaeon]
MELKATQHGYEQNTYHLVFVPKCRYKYFMYQGIKKLCKKAFYGIAYCYNFKIHSLEIQPDHIHLFVSFAPSFSISKVVQLFKGIHFWSAGKFYRSVGNVTAETIQHYIEQSQHGWTFERQTKLRA